MGAHKEKGEKKLWSSTHMSQTGTWFRWRLLFPAFSLFFFYSFLVTVFWCLYILFFWWLPGVVVAAVGSLISPCSSSLTKAVCSACYFGQFTSTWLLIAVNWRRKRRGKSSLYPFFRMAYFARLTQQHAATAQSLYFVLVNPRPHVVCKPAWWFLNCVSGP